MTRIVINEPADLDEGAILACADGASPQLSTALTARVDECRRRMLGALADAGPVYGVTTGMGAQSGRELRADAQADQSRRLLLARAVGGPPWLDRREARAVIAVRLRTLITGESGVSSGLCRWLADLLAVDLVPRIPRTGCGCAGEIIPLSHAFGSLAGIEDFLPAEGAAEESRPETPALGAKEGIALLQGVPVATALALVRADDVEVLTRQATVVAAAELAVVAAPMDPCRREAVRADPEQSAVTALLRDLVGDPAPAAMTQAPVSFRVVGPALATLTRTREGLRRSAGRALWGVTDSPIFVDQDLGAGQAAGSFIGTAGFHGVDLAVWFESVRIALAHVAEVGAARLHRLLDTAVTGLPMQLSAEPGPQAGLVAVHKRVVADLHRVVAGQAAPTGLRETSLGQEDVQSFAVEAADRLRETIAVARLVLAAELLAVCQARRLRPARLGRVSPPLVGLLDEADRVLPAGCDDRPWGTDLGRLQSLLTAGWGRSIPGAPGEDRSPG